MMYLLASSGERPNLGVLDDGGLTALLLVLSQGHRRMYEALEDEASL